MEATEPELIDDAWISVFSYITTFELASLATHLLNNGAAVTDLNLAVVGVPFASTHFNEILQFKSLRRLAFRWNSFSGREFSFVVPACRYLRLLNLTSFHRQFNDEDLTTLLSGLPNLEEMYFGSHPQFTPKPFAQAKKLQRVSYSVLTSIEDEELVKICPSLKFVVKWNVKRTAGAFGANRSNDPYGSIFKRIGDTIVLSTDSLLSLTNEQLNLVGPILTPYLANSTLPYLAHLISTSTFPERIEYFIKELKFDVNGRLPAFPFRPSFIEPSRFETMEVRSDLVYYATQTSTNGMLETLLKLGASAEAPARFESYLSLARGPDEIILLLNHGADPNKLIKASDPNIKIHIPAYVDALMYSSKVRLRNLLEVSKYTYADVIKEFAKKNCDLNIVIEGETLFEILLTNGKFSLDMLITAMMSAGAKLSSTALGLILLHAPQKLREMFENNEVDASIIDVQLIAYMIHRQMQDLIEPLIKDKSSEVDGNGLTLLHHLILLHNSAAIRPRPARSNRPGPRWEISLPDRSQKFQGFTNLKSPTPPSSLKAASFSFGSNPLNPSNTRAIAPVPAVQPSLASGIQFNFQSKPFSFPTNTFSVDTSKQLNWLFSSSTSKPVTCQETFKLNPALLMQLQDSVNVRSLAGETALLALCKAGIESQVQKDRVEMLLELGPDVNLADNNGWTPLHAALYNSSWGIAKLLVQHGANVNAQDKLGVTPLMAALYGFKHFEPSTILLFDEDFLEFLKNEQVDRSLTKHFNQTLLHLLACIGSEALGEVVLGRSLDTINARDANGFTPLHYAIMFDNYHMIPLLIKSGADLNSQTTSLRLTPLMLFISMVSTDFQHLTYLTHYNVLMFASRILQSSSVTSIGGDILYPQIIEAPWNFESKGSFVLPSFTTEVDAVMEKIWSLLEKADCSLVDAQGNTLLHYIISYAQFDITVTNSLINHYGHQASALKALWGKKNCLNDTPFSLLCRHLTEKTMDQSVPTTLYNLAKENSIDMNGADSRGYSPLHYILKSPISAYLKTQFFNLPGVDMVGDIRAQNDFISTVLDQRRPSVCVENDLLTRLIHANPGSVNSSGMTVLMQLILKYSTDMTQQSLLTTIDIVLASGKSNINAQSVNGDTALHFACRYFHTGILESIFGKISNVNVSASCFMLPFKLIQAGADPTIQNSLGETALIHVPDLLTKYQKLYEDWIRAYIENFDR